MTQNKIEELIKNLIKEALTNADVQLYSNEWSEDELIKDVTIENIKFSGENDRS